MQTQRLQPVIQTTGLTLRFGDLVAVDGLNLCVPAGTVYGFLGLNGAGKTSTIRMLLGLVRPAAGEIRLFGELFLPSRRAVLKQVGALVEAPSVYTHLTGYENLELARILIDGSTQQIKRSLAIVGLEKDARRPVREYSQGMRQRLGLALALLNSPQLLILDEPTNGLDPAGIREMRNLIGQLSAEQGITVFLSSHLLSEIEQVATHIGIIHKGRLLFQDTPDALHARLQAHVRIDVDQSVKAKHLLEESGWLVAAASDQTLHVLTHKRTDAATINAQLVHAGLGVSHVSIDQPSLEDIFLNLTGEANAEERMLVS